MASTDLYVPPATATKIATGAAKGNRHGTMFEIALPLLGNGMSREAVFAQLRSTFPDPDKTDREIWDVITWCESKNPTPSGHGDRPAPAVHHQRRAPSSPPPAKLPPREAVTRCIGDQWLSEASWNARSKSPIPALPADQTRAMLLALYGPGDKINIVTKHFVGDDGKAKPHGGGKTLTRDAWLDYFAEMGLPKSKAGVWVRPNPCGPGSGKDGAITDGDILDFRFAFLESDMLSVAEQLSFFGRTGLPIAAIVLSGGGSCHAWVRIDAATQDEYRERVAALYAAVTDYGIDKANKNSSRLSRLPGAHRKIGATGDGIQRLIYLDGDCRGDVLTPAFLERMAATLRQPPPVKRPLESTVLAAADRYEALIANRGRTGLLTGIPEFDKMSGGLKRKQMYVVAAESKCGKSTLCLNIINFAAVVNRHPVALFSMEMDRDELMDLLVAMNGSVNRNAFNTGVFFDADVQNTTRALTKIAEAPLHIFDHPLQTLESIREEALRLKAATDLALVVVDYLQLCTPSDSYRDNREQQIAAIGRGLRILASEADVPVIAVSQINDDGKLRESRAVGHAAHAVFILEEIDPTNDGPERQLRLKIERARSMPRGAYPILFETLYCRMTEGSHSTAAPVKQGDIRKKR